MNELMDLRVRFAIDDQALSDLHSRACNLPMIRSGHGRSGYNVTAVSDALFIGAAALLGVLARRLWPGGFWPVFLLVLVATAAVIELRALAAGRWAYAEAMPTVFTVGLSPLVQLGLTGAVAVLVAWRGAPGGPGRSR